MKYEFKSLDLSSIIVIEQSIIDLAKYVFLNCRIIFSNPKSSRACKNNDQCGSKSEEL
ncbi:hypothetical protein TRIP_C20051 [Candidatus Zixiibacteriota bacterium]|nr:hypothetical protein TRIP_C20051 [candidate division Zixibacteria bacterium]